MAENDRPDLASSLDKLHEAVMRGPEVEHVTSQLVAQARANHFAEMVISAMTPRRAL